MSDSKRAQIEAMMAKKRAADEQRGRTSKGVGSSRGATMTSSMSSVVGKVVVMSAPRTVNRETCFDAKVIEVCAGEGDGLALVPLSVPDASFQVAPLTDDKGGYVCKFDSDFKKTEERKPICLAEYGQATVKIINGPAGPTDWATNPAIFPGATVSIKNVAINSVFKKGVHVSGTYVNSSPSPANAKMLDLEMPAAAFALVDNDKGIARRNIMLSTVTGGFTDAWQFVTPTDKTKLYANTMLDGERSQILNPDGAFIQALKVAAAEGDEQWKLELESLAGAMVDSAPFQTTGLGCAFQVAANGPTLVVPLHGLSRDQCLSDGMPAEDSKGFRAVMVDDETLDPNDLPFFETAIVDTEKLVFGDSRNKEGRASGGPWLNLSMNAYTMAPTATDLISLDSKPFTVKLGLAAMPAFFGSKCIATITALAKTFVPLCNGVVAFEADLKNVRENPKAAESWDCRLNTVDLHSALIENGIPLDVDAVVEAFKELPVDTEKNEIASTLVGSPKPLLACGFTLLNENLEARSNEWLEQQKDQLMQILKFKKRSADVTIEMRGINPKGFEAHKASFKELEKIDDLVERVGQMEPDWLVYAVLIVTNKEGEEDDDEEEDDEDEEDEKEELPPAKKPKSAKPSASAPPTKKKK